LFFSFELVGSDCVLPPEPEDAVETTHIHHEPCSRCGGKLVFKDTVESPTTRSLTCFFRCEDCGHVHTVERRNV